MSDIFLHPPFAEAALARRILGAMPLEGRRATLPGYAVRRGTDGLRIALVPAAGGTVEGRLLALTGEARARLDFAMAALGAARVAVTTADGMPAEAYAFLPHLTPEEEAAGDGGSEACARLGEAVEEIMGHFGRRAPSEMPALLHGIGIRALARARGAASPTVPVALGRGLGRGDVQPVEREFSYARYFAMEEHKLRHRRFDGGMSAELDRAVFTSGDAVTVLPFDPGAGTVLMIEQFRAAPYARRDPRPWCLETVAGRCDRAEPLEETARREAREEAGLELGRLERIAAYYPSPGIVAEHITAFVGEADLSAAGGVHGLAEENEDIRVVVVPLETAVAAIAGGEVNNAPLILSLLWLDRNAARLMAAWR